VNTICDGYIYKNPVFDGDFSHVSSCFMLFLPPFSFKKQHIDSLPFSTSEIPRIFHLRTFRVQA